MPCHRRTLHYCAVPVPDTSVPCHCRTRRRVTELHTATATHRPAVLGIALATHYFSRLCHYAASHGDTAPRHSSTTPHPVLPLLGVTLRYATAPCCAPAMRCRAQLYRPMQGIATALRYRAEPGSAPPMLYSAELHTAITLLHAARRCPAITVRPTRK